MGSVVGFLMVGFGIYLFFSFSLIEVNGAIQEISQMVSFLIATVFFCVGSLQMALSMGIDEFKNELLNNKKCKKEVEYPAIENKKEEKEEKQEQEQEENWIDKYRI